MSEELEYIKGESETITLNNGNTITFTCCYAKETPEGFWDDVYWAMDYIGMFDHLKNVLKSQ